jgi:hypothetical protein
MYSPRPLIVPRVDVPPATPPTLQVTADPVRLCVEPSLYVPVAVSKSEVSRGTGLVVAVTAMDTSAGGVPIVSLAVPTIPDIVAEMVVEPNATPVAKPVALMVANALLLELQETELVRFCVLPSV